MQSVCISILIHFSAKSSFHTLHTATSDGRVTHAYWRTVLGTPDLSMIRLLAGARGLLAWPWDCSSGALDGVLIIQEVDTQLRPVYGIVVGALIVLIVGRRSIIAAPHKDHTENSRQPHSLRPTSPVTHNVFKPCTSSCSEYCDWSSRFSGDHWRLME